MNEPITTTAKVKGHLMLEIVCWAEQKEKNPEQIYGCNNKGHGEVCVDSLSSRPLLTSEV